MTDFTKTITVGLGLVGLGNAVYWGSGMVWGSSNWGEQSIALIVYHQIISTMSVSTTIGKDIAHQFATTMPINTSRSFDFQFQINDSLSLDSSKSSDFVKSYGNDLNLVSAPNEINVLNGPYSRICAGGSDNWLSCVSNAYALSSTSSTWTTAAAASTTWS
jgi:hypothetical protein